MKIVKNTIDLQSSTQIEFLDITDQVREFVTSSQVRDGQVLVYSQHSTMGISINHNEPLLLQDFMRIFYKLVPVDDQYTHDLFELKKASSSDGRSNGHSHCKAIILGSSETIPIEGGSMLLGANQSIFVVEFDGARKRDVHIQILGE
jgi:secondary thiamine-phosphate synthase enzyme